MKKFVITASVLLLSQTLPLQAEVSLTDADLTDAYHSVSYNKRTAVHDPSIVVDSITSPTQTTYYVFGSHMGVSKTTDLRNWTGNVCGGERTNAKLYGTRQTDGSVKTCSYNEAFKKNEVTSIRVLRDGAVCDTTFGTFDAAAWNTAVDNFTVQGNQWAADVIYNPTMGKWLYYVSLNGSKWNSVIVCMAADHIEGPYVYQGPVIFSGFDITTGSPSYKSSDMEHVLGTLSALPSRYNRGDKWGTYWPHAIDPNVFYDENGKLWMAYGSWSGGIYVIELDETTGLRDYTTTYEGINNSAANVSSDPYFGKKIAGGYYVSGEGAYIKHIGDYYYLFISYGFYSPEGGYEMRIFRSENPDGPYRDCSSTNGVLATYTSYQMNYGPKAATSRGMKLMGGYRWDPMPVAELAQGHNSAMTDSEGRSFVVYHTKFNDGTAGHAVRVHQLHMNAEGWPCAAPYEYSATDCDLLLDGNCTREDLCGTYQVIRHTYKTDYENYAHSRPANITLHADGTVTGAYKGTWEVTSGSSEITLVLDFVTYKGCLTKQTIDYTDIPAYCFTAVSSSSGTAGATRALSIWGSKAEPKGAIAYTRDKMEIPVSDNGNIYADLQLPTQGLLGTTISWSSDQPEILSNIGQIGDKDGEVTLTMTLSKDDHIYSKSYKLKVIRPQGDLTAGLKAHYDFDQSWSNRLNAEESGTPLAGSAGTAPIREKNSLKGSNVVRQYFGYPDASSSSYTRFPNALQGEDLTTEGATISLYVLRTADNDWDAIWAFLDSDNSDGIEGRCYLTANTYLGFNGTGGWFDANYPSTNIDLLETNVWHLLTLTFTAEGWAIYLDGQRVYDQQDNVSFSSGSGFSDYSAVTRLLASASELYFGYGSWWGSAPVLLDDLTLYARALTDEEVVLLYQAQRDGTFATQTAITPIETDRHNSSEMTPDTIYDLQGRRTTNPRQGLYLINGKKRWIR